MIGQKHPTFTCPSCNGSSTNNTIMAVWPDGEDVKCSCTFKCFIPNGKTSPITVTVPDAWVCLACFWANISIAPVPALFCQSPFNSLCPGKPPAAHYPNTWIASATLVATPATPVQQTFGGNTPAGPGQNHFTCGTCAYQFVAGTGITNLICPNCAVIFPAVKVPNTNYTTYKCTNALCSCWFVAPTFSSTVNCLHCNTAQPSSLMSVLNALPPPALVPNQISWVPAPPPGNLLPMPSGPWTCQFCRAVNPSSSNTCGSPSCPNPDEIQNLGNVKEMTNEVIKNRRYCKECSRKLSTYLDAYHGINPEAARLCSDCRFRRKLH
jgi:hypothetical protein